MEQLGPTAEGVEAVVEVDPDHWVVEVEGGQTASIERRQDLGVITVSTPVGRALTDRLRVYETALVYNSLWRQSGGARISMAGIHQDLTLSLELPAFGLELVMLVGALSSVVAKGAIWSRYVRSDGAAPAPTSAPIFG
jgi:Tir chaperone protein (CesT) family